MSSQQGCLALSAQRRACRPHDVERACHQHEIVPVRELEGPAHCLGSRPGLFGNEPESLRRVDDAAGLLSPRGWRPTGHDRGNAVRSERGQQLSGVATAKAAHHHDHPPRAAKSSLSAQPAAAAPAGL